MPSLARRAGSSAREPAPETVVVGKEKVEKLIESAVLVGRLVRPHPNPLPQERERGKHLISEVDLPPRSSPLQTRQAASLPERIFRAPSPGGEGRGEGEPSPALCA